VVQLSRLQSHASSVHEEFIRKEKTWNAWPLATANKVFSREKQEMLRSRLATLANASADEIALTKPSHMLLQNSSMG